MDLKEQKKYTNAPEITFIFTGIEVFMNTRQFTYKEVVGDKIIEDKVFRFSKALGIGLPGSVCIFKCDSEKGHGESIYTQSFKFLYLWGGTEEKDEYTLKLQTEYRAKRKEYQVKKDAKKNSSRDLLEERLRPIRESYKQLSRIGQHMLIMEIIGIVTV